MKHKKFRMTLVDEDGVVIESWDIIAYRQEDAKDEDCEQIAMTEDAAVELRDGDAHERDLNELAGHAARCIDAEYKKAAGEGTLNDD